MGLFDKVMALLRLPKKIKMDSSELPNDFSFFPNETKRKIESYGSLTTEEFCSLPENELLAAAAIRTKKKLDVLSDAQEDYAEAIRGLSKIQRTFYTAHLLDSEVDNGGLCEFFINSSRNFAPYVSDALSALDAYEHKYLFDSFVLKHHIDLNDLSSFICDEEDENEFFEKQYERYPFWEDFDKAYYELPRLADKLIWYLNQHREEF